MANGKIRFGKQSGGQLALVMPDGVTNTEVVFPESGDLVNKDYVDDAILKTKQYVDSTKAPLASPALTGVPTAPTAAAGTNNTQIATTAFVQANKTAINASSVASGTAGIGYGAVGSYVFAKLYWGSSNSISKSGGDTVAGSSLHAISLDYYLQTTDIIIRISPVVLSGTWRCMSGEHVSNKTFQGVGLWLRIA